VTPRGGQAQNSGRGAGEGSSGDGSAPSRRVSREPVRVSSGSPAWLPVVMFGLLAVGILVILLNYLGVLPGAPTNWYLLAGLGAILGGIIAATQYR
jgi:hypothetical protein